LSEQGRDEQEEAQELEQDSAPETEEEPVKGNDKDRSLVRGK
jgi:hypothetical protein